MDVQSVLMVNVVNWSIKFVMCAVLTKKAESYSCKVCFSFYTSDVTGAKEELKAISAWLARGCAAVNNKTCLLFLIFAWWLWASETHSQYILVQVGNTAWLHKQENLVFSINTECTWIIKFQHVTTLNSLCLFWIISRIQKLLFICSHWQTSAV